MTRNDHSLLKWIVLIGVLILLGAMTFVAGFGTGFGTGRLTAPQLASLRPAASVASEPDPESKPVAPRLQTPGDLPEEFDLIWEAWDALEQDFYGDLPDTPEMVGGIVSGILRAAEQEIDQPLDREETAEALMRAALASLEEQYGQLPEASRLSYGGIDGITFTLNDEYTGLMEPEEANFFNEGLSGSFEGIGARVDTAKEGGVLIVEPFEGQPAWNAGIRRNDVILAVDGQDVTDLPLQEAISLIRGPKGTSVLLKVQSPDQEPRDITVVRDRISILAVEYEMLDGNIAYLRLGEFSAPASEQVRDALKELLANESAGLVLDLRGNPGGFLRTAIDISSEFIPEGVVVIERFKDGKEETYEVNGAGLATEVPLVVLINEASASA